MRDSIAEKNGFNCVYGDEEQGLFIFNETVTVQIEGKDHVVYIAVEIGELSPPMEDGSDTFITMGVVAPTALSKKDRENVLSSLGWSFQQEITEMGMVEACFIHGYTADIWQNILSLESLREKEGEIWEKMKGEAQAFCVLSGFALDKVTNSIGNTGWDWLKGKIG